MICEIIIIHNGIPIFNKAYSNEHYLFSKKNELVMLSGFFSALNMFSNQYKDLGTIKELKLSNTTLKLSFFRNNEIPNLFFLVTYDDNSVIEEIQELLELISEKFLQKFSVSIINNWKGNINEFESFNNVIEYLINAWDKNLINHQDKFMHDGIGVINDRQRDNLPEFYKYVPYFRFSKNINPKHYLTGNISNKVFSHINGKKNINIIASELNLNQEQVFDACKSMCKMGLVNFVK